MKGRTDQLGRRYAYDVNRGCVLMRLMLASLDLGTSFRMAHACLDLSKNLAELLPGWQGGPVIPVMVSLGRLVESLTPGIKKGDRKSVV